mgnify:CR=1 FL=1
MKKLLLILLCIKLILLTSCDSKMLSNYRNIFFKTDKETIYNEQNVENNLRDSDNLRKDTIKEKENLPPTPPPPPPPIYEEIIIEDEEEIENEFEIDDYESYEDEEIIIEEEEREFYMVVENMPEFPGGDLGLMKYIQKNVRYPDIAKEYNITGKVYVSFIVDKTGSVSNVKIVRGVDKNLDAEALRVIKSLPKYTPGTQRGRPVRVMFTIPVNFKLN